MARLAIQKPPDGRGCPRARAPYSSAVVSIYKSVKRQRGEQPCRARAEPRRAVEPPKPEAASHRSHCPPCCPLRRPSHRPIGIRAHGTPIDFLARLRSGSHPLQPAHALACRARAWLRFLKLVGANLSRRLSHRVQLHHHKGGRRPKAEATDVHVNLNPIAANRL